METNAGCAAQPPKKVPRWRRRILGAMIFLVLFLVGPPMVGLLADRDPMDTYQFIHTDPEDRALEEQLIGLLDNFQDECVYFQPNFTRLYTLEGQSRTSRFYDPELERWFEEEILALIPRIPELGKYGLYFELRAILAQLDDAHACLFYDSPQGFPVTYWSFDTEEGYDVHLIRVPVLNRELLFAKVLEVNGVGVLDVIEKMKPYISWENEYGLRHELFRNREFSHVELWEHIGIQPLGAEEMTLTLELADGTVTEASFRLCTEQELTQMPMVGRITGAELLTGKNQHLNYWYQWLDEEQMLYIRFHDMEVQAELPLPEMTAQIQSIASQSPRLRFLVVDYRNNPGGDSDMEGFDELTEALDALQAEQVYIVTDQDTFSAGVMCAAQMDLQIDGSVLIGMPTAEPAYLHGAKRFDFADANYCIPRSTRIYIDDGLDALYPQITIAHTIDDYRAGRDPVLDYIREQ